MQSEKTSVCIIGAGPSGLSIIKQLLPLQNIEFSCYEKQSQAGGQWLYTHYTGQDQFDAPFHNSMYQDLYSNSPKEANEYPDYTFIEHFNKNISSYPSREYLLDYIIGRAKKYINLDIINYNHCVRNCQWSEKKQLFDLEIMNTNTQSLIKKTFHKVVVCTGHHSYPNYPSWKGFEEFTGRILHSHDFRDAREMTGKRVLIIGSSTSAEEIGLQCYKYGAKSTYFSIRKENKLKYKWPTNFKIFKLLDHIENDICVFQDGEREQIDVIILCTGYQHVFPFLEPQLRIDTANCMCPNDLYESVVFIDNPNLFFMGMQFQGFTLILFDIQAHYVSKIIDGQIKLPSKQEMISSLECFKIEEDTKMGQEAELIKFQGNYMKRIIEKSGYPFMQVDKLVNNFLELIENKKTDIITFKDQIHQSVMSGIISLKPSVNWVYNFDPTDIPKEEESGLNLHEGNNKQ